MKTLDEMESEYNIYNTYWERIDCPHLRGNLSEWHDPNTWDNYDYIVPNTSMSNITIPIGKNVIIRSCSSVATEDDPYQRVK